MRSCPQILFLIAAASSVKLNRIIGIHDHDHDHDHDQLLSWQCLIRASLSVCVHSVCFCAHLNWYREATLCASVCVCVCVWIRVYVLTSSAYFVVAVWKHFG